MSIAAWKNNKISSLFHKSIRGGYLFLMDIYHIGDTVCLYGVDILISLPVFQFIQSIYLDFPKDLKRPAFRQMWNCYTQDRLATGERWSKFLSMFSIYTRMDKICLDSNFGFEQLFFRLVSIVSARSYTGTWGRGLCVWGGYRSASCIWLMTCLFLFSTEIQRSIDNQ